jgi:NADH:ubiquinone oxidoreductase subunit 3 (subunit A)
MPYFLVALLFVIVFLFSLASVSQSYATAQQAQAAIEASRSAQIASTGNLVTIVTVTLVIVAILVAVVMIAWLVLRAKSQPKRQWSSSRNGGSDQFQQPDANALIPALMTLLLYEMTQHRQHDAEQTWLNESALNDTLNDTPAFPDNTWDM